MPRDDWSPENLTPTDARWERWHNGAFYEYRCTTTRGEYRTSDTPSNSKNIVDIPNPDIAREKKRVRGLFTIYIVDPESGRIVYKGDHVALDEGTARMQAAMSLTFKKDLDLLDVVSIRLGNIRDLAEIQSQRLSAKMLERFEAFDQATQIEPPAKKEG